jgi:hypothetical protein
MLTYLSVFLSIYFTNHHHRHHNYYLPLLSRSAISISNLTSFILYLHQCWAHAGAGQHQTRTNIPWRVWNPRLHYSSGINRTLFRYTATVRAGVAQAVWCLTTDWTCGRSGFDSRQRQRIFPIASVSKPALEPIQLPIRWVPGALSPGVKRGRGVTLIIHPI